MINVLHIITRLDRGGSSEVLLLLAERLNKEIFSTQIISGFTQEPQEDIETYIKRTGVKIEFIPDLCRELSPLKEIFALKKLYSAIKKVKPDIVHTHSSKAGILGRIAAALCNVPIIIHSPHGHVFYGYFGSFQNRLIVFIERVVALLTDRIINLTESGKRDHIELGISSPKKFVVIHCGIELEPFLKVNIERKEKLRHLGIPYDKTVVGTVSRLEPIKGQEYFIQACKLISLKRPDVIFVIVGGGSLENKLKKMAVDLDIDDRVYFLGHRKDVPELMKLFEIFVLPSLNEGLGRVLVEAMTVGLPIIATKVGGISDVVLDGKTGLLVPPRDSHNLAESILKLLENKDLVQKMGEKGKARANIFDINKMVEKIEALYQLLNSEKRP